MTNVILPADHHITDSGNWCYVIVSVITEDADNNFTKPAYKGKCAVYTENLFNEVE